MPGVTTSSPAMLLAELVGETKRIRLGSGGMMFPNPPLVVAEQFGLLASFAPGRIDLGVARAPGTGMTTAAALRRGAADAEDFPTQLMELIAFLDDDFPATVWRLSAAQALAGSHATVVFATGAVVGRDLAVRVRAPWQVRARVA